MKRLVLAFFVVVPIVGIATAIFLWTNRRPNPTDHRVDHAARPKSAAEDFHREHYDSRVWLGTTWFGVPIQKSPLDLQVFQELIWELKPDLIVEAGTYRGGSALFFATILDAIGHGRIVSMDIVLQPDLPRHPRIVYLLGDSKEQHIVRQVRQIAASAKTVLVDLDSDHHYSHVLAEMRAYAPLVTKGSYLIVEDTNINGHPVYPTFGPGPAEAVAQFLKQNHSFVQDRGREKFLVTFNGGGWLKRVQ